MQLHDAGYQVTIGEVWRPVEMAKIYEAKGAGIPNSLHCLKLAVDLNIFLAGKLLATVEEILPVGQLWEIRSGEFTCCWGGRFAKPDANHFSVTHGGVR